MTQQTYSNAFNPVMSATNTVTVLGAVARDPDIKDLKSGGKMIRVTVAGEELIVDQEGKTRRLPFYEQVVYVGKRAEKLIEMGLKAGEAVLLDGKFKMRVFTDADGVERKNLEIDYGSVRRALGFADAERSKDAGGAIRLVGGFCRASVYGKIVGQGGELRYTQSGQGILNFSVNARASWKDADGTWQNDAAFVRATIWGQLATELAELNVAKGMEAFIEGRPNRGSYEKDGKTIYTLDITAHRVVIAEGVESSSGSYSGGGLDALPDPFAGLDDGGLDVPEEDLPF